MFLAFLVLFAVFFLLVILALVVLWPLVVALCFYIPGRLFVMIHFIHNKPTSNPLTI
jgi:hypothetical protein